MERTWDTKTLSDDLLLKTLAGLIRRGNEITATVLAHIAEVDARKLYCELGFSSMFQYVVIELGLSEAAAKRRITAARLARRFPVIWRLVAEGAGQALDTFRRGLNGWWRSGTVAAVPLWAEGDDGAVKRRTSSFIMWIPMPSVARPRWRMSV